MKVKLSMISFSYKENESKKTVTAIVKAKSRIGSFIKPITAVGVAKCDDKDEYDVEKGKRVARAKAEKDAYVQHKKHIYENLEYLENVHEVLLNGYMRTQRYIDHQKDYIKSF